LIKKEEEVERKAKKSRDGKQFLFQLQNLGQ
jgi:hypothetical protein